MTKHNHLHFLPAMVLMLMALMTSANSYADEVTVVSDRWYPYSGTPNSPDPGYMIELLRTSLAKGGHTVKYQLMSWDRAINQVREGKKNCVVGAMHSEAEGFVFPQTHQGVVQIGMYRSVGDDWTYSGPESLKGLRVGVVAGYDYDEFLMVHMQQQLLEKAIEPARGKFAVEENLMALIRGDLDVVLDSKVVIEAAITKQGWQEKIEVAGDFDIASKIYLACSPVIQQSTEYVKLMDVGLEELRANGQLKAILNKYGLQDWRSVVAVDN